MSLDASVARYLKGIALKNLSLKQIFLYSIVGTINTCIDLVVLNVLILLTHTGRSGLTYAIFKTIAFMAAVLNSYLMNRSWTFQAVPAKRTVKEGGQFFFISILGAIVNVGSSWYVATFVPALWGFENYWPSVGALVGTGCSLGFNFLGYKFWVFAPRPAQQSEPSQAACLGEADF